MAPEPKAVAPLVSIMMPALNAGKTIRFALASLIAQSYKNWECIVVDDGSRDDTFEVAHSIGDPRIRLFRQDFNRGEAAARQRALDECRGEILGMLDADDWVFPDKLEKQVDALLANPDVSLVSCGMAIVGHNGNLFGVRAMGTGKEETCQRPGKIPVAHAPSLFRRKDAGALSYDFHLRTSIDADFLRRLLLGRNYIDMPYIGYCYREIESARLSKVLAGYVYNIRGLAKFFVSWPLVIGWTIAKEMSKIPIYLVLGPLGLFEYLIKKRSRSADEAEKENFLRMKAAVQDVYNRLDSTQTP